VVNSGMSERPGRGNQRHAVRRKTPVALLFVVCAGLASCGTSVPSSSVTSQHGGSAAVDIVVTPAKCSSEPSSAPPGVVNFTVTNKNASSVTEVELRQADGYLLAEQPNLAPGALGGISASLTDGTYQIYCPGAEQTTSSFMVTGASTGPTWKKNPRLVLAVHNFSLWISTQMGLLVSDTRAFASAVEAGNLSQAEALYVPAREDFESVEAATESYGTLYPDIDGQIENFGNPSEFEGFHEIEEAMWVGGSLSGQSKYAMQLVDDVEQLQSAASKAEYQPAQIGDFASAQLTEASNYLVTGSEERYSNLELADLKGTLGSTEEAITLLEPALSALAPAVLDQLNSAMASASAALSQCTQSPGSAGSGYESYTAVGTSQRETLAQSMLDLAAPVARATQLVA
jgi:iron uptake system component EfeO